MTTGRQSVVDIAPHSKVRFLRAVPALLFGTILMLSFLSETTVGAYNLGRRSIEIGTSLAGEVTTHVIRYRTTSTAVVGSVVFEYCSNVPVYGAPCTAPSGLNVNSANIDSQSGIAGLSISGANSTVNKLVLTRTASAVGSVNAVVALSGITNQTNPNESVFVRISTHTATNGSGSPIDSGAVVYSTASGVGVGGYVPPYLTFCVGVTVDQECDSTSGSLMGLGELSVNSANAATSQFSAATNDLTGYNVYVSGGTMTSGNEVIPALFENGGNSTGNSQFGINLRSNTNPSVGADASGSSSAQPIAGYGTQNSFRYRDGERIVSSTKSTDFTRFTVTYLVNVSTDQKPGIYASSFTYTAIASF